MKFLWVFRKAIEHIQRSCLSYGTKTQDKTGTYKTAMKTPDHLSRHLQY